MRNSRKLAAPIANGSSCHGGKSPLPSLWRQSARKCAARSLPGLPAASRPGERGQEHAAPGWAQRDGSSPPEDAGASMLGFIKSLFGEVPSILLRDVDATVEPPVVRPSSTEMPSDHGRYQLLGEIGHGGMGAVLKGRDPDLGRDLALKVLLDEWHDHPQVTRRFVEEAQIGGQLQHPGIVPVYELGAFDDGRPYFTMKLVKGPHPGRAPEGAHKPGTRPATIPGNLRGHLPDDGLCPCPGCHSPGFETVEHHGGCFRRGAGDGLGIGQGAAPRRSGGRARPHTDETGVSVIRTVRSGSDADKSRRGSLMGTPAYMPPEQAGGDIEAIDERADVFGLGSILCEILTGLPAYVGPTYDAVERKAKRGDTAGAMRRLDVCGADGELVGARRDCLAVEPLERPREAGELARRITAYVAGVQERLRSAELARAAEEARAEEAIATAAEAERARAAEEARAEEARKAAVAADGRARAERKARRMTVGLAASVLVAAALGTAGWRWVERDRMVRMATLSNRVNAAVQEATGLEGQAKGAAVGDLVPWTKALAAAQTAHELVEPGLDRALRSQGRDPSGHDNQREGAGTGGRAGRGV